MTRRALIALAFSLCAVPAFGQQTTSGFDTPVGSGLPLIFANEGQKVGEWNKSSLIAQGGVQIGQNVALCVPAMAGLIRWNPAIPQLEVCNGTIWQSITCGIGCGQSWHNMAGAYWTIYRNTGPKPIEVSLACANNQNQASRYYVYVDGIVISEVGAADGGEGNGMAFIVPVNSTYEVANPDDANGDVCNWSILE